MITRMQRSRAKLSEQAIVNAEAQLGFALPAPYRNFLLLYNGGHPEPAAFPIDNNPADTHGLVQAFLCINEQDVYNLATYVKRYRNRVPAGFLPIAVDPGGNLICLAMAGARAGKVYFWDHEEEAEEGQPPTDKNVFLIANTFDEFLSRLTTLE